MRENGIYAERLYTLTHPICHLYQFKLFVSKIHIQYSRMEHSCTQSQITHINVLSGK